MDNFLEEIYRSALKFLTPVNLKETYALIVTEARRIIKTDYGSLFIMEEGELKRVHASSLLLHKIKIRKRGNTYRTFKYRKPNVIDATSLRGIHPQFRVMGIKSIISIPLINKGKSIGVLSLQSRKNKYFTTKQLQTLKFLGSLATMSIGKAQLYEEVENALQARDLFISMAAHELRTPITTINGYAQMLYTKLAGSDTAEARWISDLSWETLRLTYLINELLEIDRIKTGQFKYFFKECLLREIVRRALSDFRFSHPRHKIILESKLKNGEDKVIGDFDKLLQLIINLLDNAAKFSAPDTEIRIGLKRVGSDISLKIEDQGKGISKQDMSDIFEKFSRGSGHLVEGMGLGLFLVKNIVKQHHGKIQVKSKEGKGTTVEIRLPKGARQ